VCLREQVRTKAVTAGFLNAFGDVLAQFAFNEEGQAFDWKRLGIFTFLVRFLDIPMYTSIHNDDAILDCRELHLLDHPFMYGMEPSQGSFPTLAQQAL